MRRVIESPAGFVNQLVVFALILSFGAVVGSTDNSVAGDSNNFEYLFVITGDTGTYKDGKLTLTGVPIISFNYLGSNREVGHFLVRSFTKLWETNSSGYSSEPPSGTLSILDENGPGNAVIKLSNPSSALNTISFTAKVLEGSVPESFNASSLFLELKTDKKLDTQN